MFSTRITLTFAILIVAGIAFWAGSEIQKATYVDQCLDLGGGRNPGNHPICVINASTAPLQLGPILVTAQEVIRGEIREGPDGQSLVELSLKPGAAAALAAFTKESVGGSLDIRVDGNQLRSVNIIEGVEGDQLIIPLTNADAQSLFKNLGLVGL